MACSSGGRVSTTVPDKDSQPKPTVNRYAFAYYTSGVLAEKEGQYPAAIRYYQQALEHSPGNPDILYALADLYFNLRQADKALETAQKIFYQNKRTLLLIGNAHRVLSQNDKAEEAFRKVLKLDPNNVEAHWYIAAFAERRGDLKEAEKHLEEVARLNPTARIFTEIARLNIINKDRDGAEEAYIKSISIDSTEANLESYINLVALYEEDEKFDAAERILNKAVRVNPNNPNFRLLLTEFYSDRGDTTRALDEARTILHMDTEDTEVLSRTGFLAWQMNDDDLADSLFARELEISPESVFGNYYRGRIAIIREQPNEAKEYFWRMISAADSLPDGYISLGLVYLEQDSVEQAIDVLQDGVANSYTNRQDLQYYLATALGRAEEFNRVIPIASTLAEQSPEDIRYLFLLGSSLERTQQFDSAATVFQKILKIDPNHAQTLNYLGYMWADIGTNLEQAREMIERALELDSENGAFLDSYAWVLYKLGRYEEAREYITRAIAAMDEPDPVMFEHYGDIQFALGNLEEAREQWARALELDPDNEAVQEKLNQ